MTRYTQLAKQYQVVFLGTDNADASDGVLFTANAQDRIQSNDYCRTLIIGVGGCGGYAVNRIKATVSTKFANWQNRIGFLAIDTDRNALNQRAMLTDTEKLCIGADVGIALRHNKGGVRSAFTESWIHPDFFSEAFGSNGAGQTRQVSKAKILDAPGMGVSESDNIINRVRVIVTQICQNCPTGAELEIMIILGTGGGTGSGGINEIAHLGRRAILASNLGYQAHISGYFLLPDIVDPGLSPAAQNAVKVNGYAALKEMDYYYSTQQRTAVDYLTVSDPAQQAWSVDWNHPLYDMVFLVNGSGAVPKTNPYRAAMDVIVETVVNQLAEVANANQAAAQPGNNAQQGDNAQQGNNAFNAQDHFLTASFLSNKQQARENVIQQMYVNGKESPGYHAEDLFDYSAIGVSSAEIPEQIIKSYAVQQIVGAVCGYPNTLKPADFRGFDRVPLTQAASQAAIAQLLSVTLANIEDKIWELCDRSVQWGNGHQLTGRAAIVGAQGGYVSLKTELGTADPARITTEMIGQIETYLQEMLAAFKEQLSILLVDHGPSVYFNLYKGIAADNQRFAGSIESKLQTFENHRAGNVTRFSAADEGKKQEAVRDYLAHHPVLGKINHTNLEGQWEGHFRNHEVALIAERVADHVFSENGALMQQFIAPIRALSEKCSDFADVLDGLYATYQELGSAFSQHQTFVVKAKKESAVRLNLIEEETDYDWAKGVVDAAIQGRNFVQIKQNIIVSFMKEPDAWTEYDPKNPKQTARRKLDTLLAPEVGFGNALSFVAYINQKLTQANVTEAGVAQRLIDNLTTAATPMYREDRNLPTMLNANPYRYLLVPQLLFNDANNGAAIRTAFATACGAANVIMFLSSLTDKIVCYTLATALPLYSQADIAQWERLYDAAAQKMLHSNESGRGDFDPKIGLEWKNYRSLALVDDPRIPDPATGRISREGQFLMKQLDPLFDKAEKAGIIFEETDQNGHHSYSCYCLDNSAWQYKWDILAYGGMQNGLYMKGAPLLTYLAAQNGAKLADITQKVALQNQGSFNAPHPDRDEARKRAKRALRRNEPQLIAIKKTLQILEPMIEDIDEQNEVLEQKRFAVGAAQLIATGKLNCAGYQWMLTDYPVAGARGVLVSMLAANYVGTDLASRMYHNDFRYAIVVTEFFKRYRQDGQMVQFCNDVYRNFVDTLAQPNRTQERAAATDRMREIGEEANRFLQTFGMPGQVNYGILSQTLGLDGANITDDSQLDMIAQAYAQYQELRAAVMKSIDQVNGAGAGAGNGQAN